MMTRLLVFVLLTQCVLRGVLGQPVEEDLFHSHIPDYDSYDYYAIHIRDHVSTSSDSESHNQFLTKRTILHKRAQAIADDLNAVFLGRVGELPDYYQIAIPKSFSHSNRESVTTEHKNLDEGDVPQDVLSYIHDHPDIIWADQQIPKDRLVKRSVLMDGMELSYSELEGGVGNVNNVLGLRDESFDSAVKDLNITDPSFNKQWHLV
jgi:hypothetical protein